MRRRWCLLIVIVLVGLVLCAIDSMARNEDVLDEFRYLPMVQSGCGDVPGPPGVPTEPAFDVTIVKPTVDGGDGGKRPRDGGWEQIPRLGSGQAGRGLGGGSSTGSE